MDSRSMDGGSMRRMHAIHLEGRELMSVTGVKDVDSFNEQEIRLVTDLGVLYVEGNELHITKLNLDDGQVLLEGEIVSLQYGELEEERGSLFSRLFR